MDEILGQVLREAVWDRLETLAEHANHADTGTPTSAARSEIPRLAQGWRSTLREHEPDERGDCPTCSTRWHRSQTPCSVWHAAYEHLVAGGLAPMQQAGSATVAGQPWNETHPNPRPSPPFVARTGAR